MKLAARAGAAIRAVRYSGRRHCCPICGWHARRFLPVGPDGWRRENAMCARCGALERHRQLWLVLASTTDVERAPTRILHFAPEPALQRRLRGIETADYVTADLNPDLGDYTFDITDIPFEDERFDCILCSHVLEFVPDDRRAVAELYRVLASGGQALVQVPVAPNGTVEDVHASPEERFRRFGDAGHLRIYGQVALVALLSEPGFEVTIERIDSVFSPEQRQRFGLDVSTDESGRMSDLYRCVKGKQPPAT